MKTKVLTLGTHYLNTLWLFRTVIEIKFDKKLYDVYFYFDNSERN